ncbi:MAG: hypothetical protein WCT31_03465 [Candidatus Micrarchaeia archaeon]|jgi:NAD+ kinase
MKLKLLSNTKKEWAISLSRSLAHFLKSKGFSISDKSADATICIGGDGTIFHYFYNHQVHGKIVGIGSKTSSVCHFQHEKLSMKKLIESLKANRSEKHITLQSSISGRTLHAVNDVVFHSHDYRVLLISVQVGKSKHTFEGDGLIVSTPIGSSAYSYSAGGPVLKRGTRKFAVVPICPYKRSLKPMVVPANTEISISADRTADLIVDGIYVGRINANEPVHVKKGKDIEFLKV